MDDIKKELQDLYEELGDIRRHSAGSPNISRRIGAVQDRLLLMLNPEISLPSALKELPELPEPDPEPEPDPKKKK